MSPSEAFAGGAAVITGSGSGIGEALALKVAELGVPVVVAELSVERGERVAAEIRARGGKAIFVCTDVGDTASVEALADAAFAAYGNVRLLVNCAGLTVMGSICNLSSEVWDKVIDVNLRGVINGVRAFVPRMANGPGGGYVSNVASLASFSMATNNGPYFATKHAVMSLSECLYLEMEEEGLPVKVSVVVPGMVKSRIFADTIVTTEAEEAQRSMLAGAMAQIAMPADQAAQIILDGISAEDFIISTHPRFSTLLATERSEHLRKLAKPRPSSKDFIADGTRADV
jgi:NAD(P)-dependent dehydrogenase (short-subunit alcohol dehydrogenase family)